jgi:hypothetical protein
MEAEPDLHHVILYWSNINSAYFEMNVSTPMRSGKLPAGDINCKKFVAFLPAPAATALNRIPMRPGCCAQAAALDSRAPGATLPPP